MTHARKAHTRQTTVNGEAVAVVIETDAEVSIWRVKAPRSTLRAMNCPISGYCYTLAGARRQANRSYQDAIATTKR